MKKLKLVGLALAAVTMLNTNSIFAFTNTNTQILDKEKIVEEYRVQDSETSTFLNYIDKNIENGKELYKYNTYTKIGDEKNSIKKEKQEFYENIEFGDIEKIKEVYGTKREYEDNEYIGTLDNLNIQVEKIDNGTHEEIWEIKEDFKDYSINELDTVPKEITKYGYTYYLTDCIFDVSKTEKVAGADVPLAYSGTKIYQTIATVKNKDTYNISLTYSGNIERKDKVSIYTVEYNYKYIPIKEIIIVSGLGILVLLMYFILRGNTKIYNYTKGKYKLVKKSNLNNKKTKINITNKLYKIDTNMYRLKLNKSIYKKLRLKTLKVEINNISKEIFIDSDQIDFKM